MARFIRFQHYRRVSNNYRSAASRRRRRRQRRLWQKSARYLIRRIFSKASEFCRYSLGEQFTPESINARVTATQEYYGRMENLNVRSKTFWRTRLENKTFFSKIFQSSNIIFVEGSNDPWKPLQMQKQHLRAGNVLIDVKGERGLFCSNHI